MKIITVHDLLPQLKEHAEAAINAFFGSFANAHMDAEYAYKRAAAAEVLAGKEPPAPFAAEAEMMGISAQSLASKISQKPDHLALRALERRRLILAVRAAKTKTEIDSILKVCGLPPLP